MSTNDPTLTDDGYDVLPASTAPVSETEALTLEDALADPQALDAPQNPPAPLGRTPAIDFAEQTFVPSTASGPLMLYGDDTLKQWVDKCLRTRRGENPACDPQFGCDLLFQDMIDGNPYDESTAAVYEDIVSRALSVHPDIDSIEDFAIDYADGDEAAFVTFAVIKTAAGQDPLNVDVQLPATGADSA